MTAIMRIDQTGLSAGLPGVARDDGLSTGAQVTVTSLAHQGSFEVALLWVGLHGVVDTTSRASLQKSGANSFTFTPTAGALGSWRIELVTDRGTPAEDRMVRIFAVRGGGIRIPAANEQSDPEASLINAGTPYIARSEFNLGDGVTDSPQEDASFVSHWRPIADLIHAHNTGGGGGGSGAGTTVIVELGAGANIDIEIPNIKTVRVAWCQVSGAGVSIESILRPPPAAGDPAPGDYHSIFLVNGSSAEDLTIVSGGDGSYGATFVTAGSTDKVLGPYEGVLLVYLHFIAAWQVTTLG